MTKHSLMTEQQIGVYVDAACAAQGLALDVAERERVIVQFSRLAALAAPLNAMSLAPEVEPAPIFRP